MFLSEEMLEISDNYSERICLPGDQIIEIVGKFSYGLNGVVRII